MATFDPPLLDYATPRPHADRAAAQVALLAGVFVGVLLPYFLAYYGMASLVLTGVLDTSPITGAQGVQLVAGVLVVAVVGCAVFKRPHLFQAGVVSGAGVCIANSLT